MQTHEGILGSAGVILNDIYYVRHDRCGWPSHNPEVTEVDLVGHAWFFKREWLRYLWQEKPTTWDNGEDIQFAFMAKIVSVFLLSVAEVRVNVAVETAVRGVASEDSEKYADRVLA